MWLFFRPATAYHKKIASKVTFWKISFFMAWCRWLEGGVSEILCRDFSPQVGETVLGVRGGRERVREHGRLFHRLWREHKERERHTSRTEIHHKRHDARSRRPLELVIEVFNSFHAIRLSVLCGRLQGRPSSEPLPQPSLVCSRLCDWWESIALKFKVFSPVVFAT